MEEKDSFLYERHRDLESNIVKYININSHILINWLYGINILGLSGLITYDHLPKDAVIWFILSLSFCIFSTFLEWCRFVQYQKKLKNALEKYNEKRKLNENSQDIYLENIKENKAWFWGITIFRIFAYILLLIAILKLFSLSLCEILLVFLGCR